MQINCGSVFFFTPHTLLSMPWAKTQLSCSHRVHLVHLWPQSRFPHSNVCYPGWVAGQGWFRPSWEAVDSEVLAPLEAMLSGSFLLVQQEVMHKLLCGGKLGCWLCIPLSWPLVRHITGVPVLLCLLPWLLPQNNSWFGTRTSSPAPPPPLACGWENVTYWTMGTVAGEPGKLGLFRVL